MCLEMYVITPVAWLCGGGGGVGWEVQEASFCSFQTFVSNYIFYVLNSFSCEF